MTPDQESSFRAAVNCWLCGKYLGKDRVRDHCHETGDYQGAAHNRCNLLRRKRGEKLVVLMHNLKVRYTFHNDPPISTISFNTLLSLSLSQRYDGHLLLRDLLDIEGDLR